MKTCLNCSSNCRSCKHCSRRRRWLVQNVSKFPAVSSSCSNSLQIR